MNDYPKVVIDEYFYINNCLGAFFKGILSWFGDDFYPYFNYRIIGTYSKSVEFFNKTKQYNQNQDTQILPAITLDPTLDFSQDERAGRFLWQSPYLDPGLGARMFRPIDLKEQDVVVVPVFSRYQGTIEILFWLRSVYEFLDFRVKMLQFTGGYGRYIRPKHFWSFIVLPDQIKNFQTSETTTLDWGNTDATFVHIDSCNQNQFAIPVALSPILKLDSLADVSTKYGGDSIAEYKLSAFFTYEIELPTYMVLKNKIGGRVVMNFTMGNAYTKYGGIVSNTEVADHLAEADPSTEEYQELYKHAAFYRLVKASKDSAITIADYSNLDCCITNPASTDIIDWNPIRSGTLYNLDNTVDFTKISKGDIVYFENYQESYLSYIRKSGAVICKNGGAESTIYQKCKILNKPLILKISDIGDLLNYVSTIITVDTINKIIYMTDVPSEKIQKDDTDYAYEIVKNLRITNPELVVRAGDKSDYINHLPDYKMSLRECNITKTIVTCVDGIQVTFPINFSYPLSARDHQIFINDILTDSSTYTINETEISFNIAPPSQSNVYMKIRRFSTSDLQLKAIYEFTEADTKRKSDDYINIVLPFPVTSYEDLVLISYNGQLIYDRDYTYEKSTGTLTIKLSPKIDELVEIHLYNSD